MLGVKVCLKELFAVAKLEKFSVIAKKDLNDLRDFKVLKVLRDLNVAVL